MKRVAALMRAVNVGGQGAIPMAELRTMLADAGFDRPETLLASGNALIGTALTAPEAEAAFEAALVARFGFDTTVLVRDRAQLEAALAENPFEDFARASPNLMIVWFYRGALAADLGALAPYCQQGERVATGPGCLYLAYPGGSGQSKLSGAVAERKLRVKGTGRNWNTVGKLAAKLRDVG